MTRCFLFTPPILLFSQHDFSVRRPLKLALGIEMKRDLKVYIPIVIFIIALGLPLRIVPHYFPDWAILYAGDFLWATAVYFLYCLLFRLNKKNAVIASLLTAYAIEFSQLFQPGWLEQLRSIKIFSLILGIGFLWSDLIAYTLGIVVAATIDWLIIKGKAFNNGYQ
jgi:hypothetical protein